MKEIDGDRIIFSDYPQLIKAKQLPAIIQQRHDQTVATYQHAFQTVSQQLQALAQPTTAGSTEDTKRTRLNQLNALQTTLQSYRFKRSQQPFDPNQLPTRSLQPAPDNQPRLTRPSSLRRISLCLSSPIR